MNEKNNCDRDAGDYNDGNGNANIDDIMRLYFKTR